MLAEQQARTQGPDNEKVNKKWTAAEISDLFSLPFNDLIYRAQGVHREHFNPNEIQLSTLLNIKEGGCPEDCAYCPQSARYDTHVDADSLMPLAEVVGAAAAARAQGATRFCMGAAWRNPKEKDLARVEEMVRAVKALGLETCATLGMLTEAQAVRLKQAGLDYYNHNLDTSPDFYSQIISTRTYEDRLRTLENVRRADLNVCCGGILGMGETVDDRAAMLLTLANLPAPPESVPINMLVRVAGTPLAAMEDIDPFEVVKVIAVARIMMPASYIRLSAGRTEMSDGIQALCFLAGANSIFYGEKLLTTDNPQHQKDMALFQRLGLKAEG